MAMVAGGYDDMDDSMLLEPPDPVDLLMAHTEEGAGGGPRPLDFVRKKMQDLKQENKQLRERVADLEQTLSIVQSVQEWTVGKGMTPEQVEKMREIKALLDQAKRAREELQSFSGGSKQIVYEKLRACKLALRREREEKREMKDRLLHAFDHARHIRDQHGLLAQARVADHQRFQDQVRDMTDRHRKKLRQMQGEGAVNEHDRQEKMSQFGEQVMSDLSILQQHLSQVRQETVDSVVLPKDIDQDTRAVRQETPEYFDEEAFAAGADDARDATAGGSGGELLDSGDAQQLSYPNDFE